MMNSDLTVIFFSCRRLDLLKRSVIAFLLHNTYPFVDFIIVNDSADGKIHQELKETYNNATFVFNEKNVGLIESVDKGYSHVKTEYLFHCEDDWMLIKEGLIQKSLAVMLARPEIEEVWPVQYNNHPIEPKVYNVNGVDYRLVEENHQKGMNLYNDFAWHGFTTACGLKRLSDYKMVAPYCVIPWTGTVWHREQAIGERYHSLGFRSAILMDDYAENIGYGKSEYITGMEK